MPLSEGTRLGPYEIAAPVGAGGMGEVYRARDTRLGRDVAVKVLPEDAAASGDRLRRFEIEARATGALNHANVLAIYDVGVADGQPYLVEELLRGETFAEILSRGPLPPRKAAEYGAQAAAGLAAAHDRGIVHRDLKPSNIFLTADGTVKVLDFGLAKLLEREPDGGLGSQDPTRDATESGRAVGTIGYMSPEQVRGQPVDHRTDIFSLGCVLYEMVSCEKAFRRHTVADTQLAILAEDPRPLPETVPAVTQAVILHCLEKRPEDRFQATRDLAFALREAAESRGASGGARKPSGAVGGLVLHVPRRAALAAFAVAALVLAGAAFALVPRWIGPPPLPATKRMAVAGFEAAGEGPELPALAAGLSEYLARGLGEVDGSQPAGCWTVPTADARSLGAATVSDLRHKFNVNLVFTGRLRRAGESLRLELAAVDPETGRAFRSEVIEESAGNLASFQSGLVLRAAGLVGLSTPREAAERLASMTTTMPEAFRAYLEATGRLALGENAASLERASALLSSATERDPLFAAGWIALGRTSLRRYDLGREPSWLESASASAEKAVRTGRWPGEALRLQAAVEKAQGRGAASLASLESAARVDPARPEVRSDLAAAYEGAGRNADAERELERALFLRPGYWMAHHRLAKLYVAQGKYEPAANHWREAIDCAPEAVFPYSNLGTVYHSLGLDDEARRAFERSLAVEPNLAALANLGTLYFEEARFADSAAMYERALEKDDASYETWGNLGYSYKFGGSPERAATAFRRAIALCEGILRESPGDPAVAVDLADYHAMLGERARGLAIVEPVVLAKPSGPELVANVAECLWDLEDRDRAFEWLRLAFAAGVPRRRFEKRPTLHALVADPRYRSLAEEADRRR